MARNYAALPHEYLEEMAELDDGEFGRLIRALLRYSMTGEAAELSGNERFYYRRVVMREDRYQSNYEELTEKRSDAGKKGALRRWSAKEDGKNGKASLPLADDSKDGNSEAKTETEIKTNTKTETDALPSTDGKSAARAAAVGAYLDRINPTPSPRSVAELGAYADAMGSEVCLRAMDIALDSKKATWPYIRGILRRWQSLGVTCPADIERLDRKPEAKSGGSCAADRMKRDLAALDGIGRKEREDP